MSYWNYNGLCEKLSTVKKPKRKKMVEEKENKIINKLLEYNDKTYFEQVHKSELSIQQNRSSLDRRMYYNVLEDYITLRLSKFMKDLKTSENYYSLYKVILEGNNVSRNYLDCNILICWFRDEKDYKNNNCSLQCSVELKELFGNCSSIVINKLKGCISQEFANLYMSILENICTLIGYSFVLYTISSRETESYVITYIHNNKDWQKIKEGINKRNNNTIQYYIKDL